MKTTIDLPRIWEAVFSPSVGNQGGFLHRRYNFTHPTMGKLLQLKNLVTSLIICLIICGPYRVLIVR